MNKLANMTHNELIVEEYKARCAGDEDRANAAKTARWERAMGSVMNTASTGYKPRRNKA